jgi:hypothetical protein
LGYWLSGGVIGSPKVLLLPAPDLSGVHVEPVF